LDANRGRFGSLLLFYALYSRVDRGDGKPCGCEPENNTAAVSKSGTESLKIPWNYVRYFLRVSNKLHRELCNLENISH